MQNLELEKQLLEKVQNDKKYFDELYRYFLNDCYRFSYSLVQSQFDAEDLTSRTFLELYKKIDTFKWTGVSLKSWLFRTIRNFAYEKFREPNHDEFNEAIHDYESDEISFVDQIMNLELVEEVKKEIEKLNPTERELINLRIWEGMKFEEIAEIQNASVNTSIQRFKRSIAKVRKALDSRGIKSLLALPMLFTAMRQVGTTPAYAAPVPLTNSSFVNGILLKNKVKMEPKTNKFTAFFTSKVGIASIIALTAAVSATGGLVYYTSNNVNQNPTGQNELADTLIPTTTSTESVTSTPTTSIPTATNTPTPTAQITSTPTTKTYTDNDVKLAFEYPSNYTIKSGPYTPPATQTGLASKTIEIIKDANNKLVLTYSDGDAGCVGGPGSEQTMDALFKSDKVANYNIGRKKSFDIDSKVPEVMYWVYSSDRNGEGYPCDLVAFRKDFSMNYFIVIIKTNNVNQDFSNFDSVVKSIRRL